MKNEADFKRALVKGCVARGAYAVRHEDRYGLGRLDLSIKFPGLVEIKAEGKLVPHQSFSPTKRQFIEGERYRTAGGLPVLLGFDPKTGAMHIHEWAETAKKETAVEIDGDHAAGLEAWLRVQ